jgi:hypothetical protein
MVCSRFLRGALPLLFFVSLAAASSCQLPAGGWQPVYLEPTVEGLPPESSTANEVACTPQGCVLIGTAWMGSGDRNEEFAFVEHDRGWARAPELARLWGYELSCASPTTCAVGVVNNAVAYDGERLASIVPIPGIGAQDIGFFFTASCGAEDHCVAAVPGAAGMSVWDGSQWSEFQATPVFARLTCVTASFCIGTHARAAHRWDGTAWTPLPAIPELGPNQAVDAQTCWAVDRCLLIASTGPTPPDGPSPDRHQVVLRWDGTAFTTVEAPVVDLVQVSSLSCSAEHRCVAVRKERPPLLRDESGWSEIVLAAPLGAHLVTILDGSCGPSDCMLVGKATKADGRPMLAAYRRTFTAR